MSTGITLTPPAGVLTVIRTLHAAEHEAWLVGGCVRDGLIGRPVGDWDITTSATPEQVIEVFERTIPTGLQHGTVTVVMEGEPIEVTTYRVEGGYTDGRRPDEISFTTHLEEDLQRRDFTVNAMAWDPIGDTLVDPYDGQGDLKRRRIRAVGRALDRLTEDGLRAMRAVRFASVLDFEIDPEAWAAIGDTLPTFSKISIERVQIELAKILKGAHPTRGLRLLRDSGLLGVFLPALAEAPEADAIFAALDEAPHDPTLRLALMLWPLAPGGAVEQATSAVDALRFSNAARRRVGHLLRWRGLDWQITEPAEIRQAVSGLVASAGDVAVVDEALALHRLAPTPGAAVVDAFAAQVDATEARQGPHQIRELAIDGKAVMAHLGIPPSRALGQILERLLSRVWADPTLNTPEGLRAALPEVAAAVIQS